MQDFFSGVAGLNLTTLAPDLCVGVRARRLPRARVLWLNSRWWRECGWDVYDAVERRAIEFELLDHFGVFTSDQGSSKDDRLLFADRYGGTFGALHGGSGRSASWRQLIAKGIGRTPLAAVDLLPSHADGTLSLIEAVREAIAGEIANAELPYGAIPAVAILSTGLEVQSAEAILIRPNFIRPAHFERSVFFGSAGTVGSDQELDARRVGQMVTLAIDRPGDLAFPGLLEMFRRFAHQIGASHANRLWQGKFLSSNASVTGALADFGSFRTVPSWHSFYGEPEEVFGREGDYLKAAFDSVSRNFRKYGSRTGGDVFAVPGTRLDGGIVEGFRQQVARELKLEEFCGSTRHVIENVLVKYFMHQQQTSMQVAFVDRLKPAWLHAALAISQLPYGEFEEKTLRQLEVALRREPLAQTNRFWRSLLRWSCPRADLSYEALSSCHRDLHCELAGQSDGGIKMLDALINTLLSRSWRKVPAHPPDFDIVGQTVDADSGVFYGTFLSSGAKGILVQGKVLNRSVRVLGRKIESVKDLSCGVDNTVQEICPCDADAMLRGCVISPWGTEVSLPPAAFIFPTFRCDPTIG